MFPLHLIFISLLSTLALAETRTHCTNPAHPPNTTDMINAFYRLNSILTEWGDRTVTFVKFSTPGLQGYRVPVYVTQNGMANNADPGDHGTIEFDIVGNDVTLEHTNGQAINKAVWSIVLECILSTTEVMHTTTAGWKVVGDTSALNVSVVDPQGVGLNSSAWLPAAAGAIPT